MAEDVVEPVVLDRAEASFQLTAILRWEHLACGPGRRPRSVTVPSAEGGRSWSPPWGFDNQPAERFLTVYTAAPAECDKLTLFERFDRESDPAKAALRLGHTVGEVGGGGGPEPAVINVHEGAMGAAPGEVRRRGISRRGVISGSDCTGTIRGPQSHEPEGMLIAGISLGYRPARQAVPTIPTTARPTMIQTTVVGSYPVPGWLRLQHPRSPPRRDAGRAQDPGTRWHRRGRRRGALSLGH